jgi:signal-transduction protein with cAMP-binding, CBS, and nucleotidyltransferase domain
MHVGDILEKQDLLTFPETATAMQAARGMTERKVGAVLVIATDGSLTGIFTERDLMARVVVEKRDLESTQLKDVMTRDLYQVGPEEEIARVRTELQRRHIRHLPIVADGKLLGVLSLRDILRADLEKMSHEVEELENYFLGGTEPAA